MKRYLVHLANLPLTPLTDHAPQRAGIGTKDFDDLSMAQSYAESEKGNWNMVRIHDRDDAFRLLESYLNGQKCSTT